MIDGKKVAFGKLRTDRAFQTFVQEVELALQAARDTYEEQPASEFLRGRVCVLRDLLNDMKGK